MTKLRVTELEHSCGLPVYGTEASSGMDLMAAIEDTIVLKPMERVLIPTGLKLELPKGHEAQIRPRSGLAYKNGITVLNTPGTIDEDYRGEVKVLLINLGTADFAIERGMRIAQMVVSPYVQASLEAVELELLGDTVRGEGGFGSTGV